MANWLKVDTDRGVTWVDLERVVVVSESNEEGHESEPFEGYYVTVIGAARRLKVKRVEAQPLLDFLAASRDASSNSNRGG